nr:RdRp [Wilkie qin-like virus]
MARVFDVPRYTNQAIRTVRAYASLEDDGLDDAARTVFGVPQERAMIGGLFSDELENIRSWFTDGGMEYPEELAQRDHSHSMGYGKDMESALGISSLVSCLLTHVARSADVIYHDDDAMFRICYLVWSGQWFAESPMANDWHVAGQLGQSLALSGCVSDKLNTVGTKRHYSGPTLYARAAARFPKLARAFTVADSFRMGLDTGDGRRHIRAIIKEKVTPDPEQCRITKGLFAKSFRDVTAYRFSNIIFLVWKNECYVIDKAAADEIHMCLRTPFGFAAYAAGYQSAIDGACERAMDAVYTLHEYVMSALKVRIRNRAPLNSIAKQMKESYAVIMADIGSGAMAGAGHDQVAQIEAEARDRCLGEEPYFVVLRTIEHRLAIDLGTYWNVLPAPDADPPSMDARLQRTMNAPREFDAALWRRFINYARGVLTAHWIFKTRDIPEDEFWVLDDEEIEPARLPWVQRCASGTLDYPPATERGHAYVVKVIPWVKKMEFWHFAAQDVTHVFADLTKYSTVRTIAAMPRTDNSELSYALMRGPYLSNDIPPSKVREAMNTGNLVGDRVLVLSAKRENTKVGEKVRETASGDDILREALSELDMNLQQIGQTLHGVAMKMGRVGFERRTNRMRLTGVEGAMYISLDVSGWSPNMVRENEMEFVDILMEMYDIPEDMRASRWFRDISIVHSRRGFHSIWDMMDASVQGFFGGADTIMHNIMAQFAKIIAVEDGILAEGTRVDFMTLIDDLAVKICQGDVAVMPVLTSFQNTYKMLGFQTDLVKTLASQTHFHFLNRMFSIEGEVITAAKIFAKADREWDRRLAGIFSHMDSAMGSVLGAVDRGACVISAYEWALTIAAKAAVTANPRVASDGLALTAFGAWLPKAMGGWGLPGVVSWVTQEGIDAITDGWAHCYRLAQLISMVDRSTGNALLESLHAATNSPLEPRSIQTAIADPFGLRYKGIVDVERPGIKLLRECASKMVSSPEFTRLISASTSNSTQAVLECLGKEVRLPAAVWAAFSETLPSAVVDKVITRATRNEVVLLRCPPVKRHAALNEIRIAGKNALRSYMKIFRRTNGIPDITRRATAVIAEKRREQLELDGLNCYDLETCPSLEVVSHVLTSGSIVVHIPQRRAQEVYNGARRFSLVRTFRSGGAIVDEGDVSRSYDPVLKAAHHLAIVVAACQGLGGTGRALVGAWSAIWLGNPNIVVPPAIRMQVIDPRRVCNRTTNMGHSVMALPNFVGAVKVNASSAVRMMENQPKAFDWVSVVTALRAMCAIDQVFGGGYDGRLQDSNGIEYHFNMSGHTGWRSDAVPPNDSISPVLESVLNQCTAVLSESSCLHVVESLGDIWVRLRPEEMQFQAGQTDLGDLHIPSIGPKKTYSAIDLLRSRGMSIADLLPKPQEPVAYSPLAGLEVAEVMKASDKPKNVDVVTRPPGHRMALDIVCRRKTDSAPEMQLVKVLVSYARSIRVTANKSEAVFQSQHGVLRHAVQTISHWENILVSWGNEHFVGLIRTKEIQKMKDLYEQIWADFDHPSAEGFISVSQERAAACIKYQTQYTDQSLDMSRSVPTRYAKSMQAAIMGGLATAAIRDESASTAMERASRAMVDQVMSYFRRDMNWHWAPHIDAVSWLATEGEWARAMIGSFKEECPRNWHHKGAIESGMRRALNNAEHWLVEDVLRREGVEEVAKALHEVNQPMTTQLPSINVEVAGGIGEEPDEEDFRAGIDPELFDEWREDSGNYWVQLDTCEEFHVQDYNEWLEYREEGADNVDVV